MTVKFIVVVKVYDKEVSRFETSLRSKDGIAIAHNRGEQVLRDGETITFEMPLELV